MQPSLSPSRVARAVRGIRDRQHHDEEGHEAGP